jgi:hypothetical protein
LAVFLKRFLAPEWVFIFGIGLGIEADEGVCLIPVNARA